MQITFMILLIIHITCGAGSLLSAVGAISSAKGQAWHQRFGHFFFYGMTGVFITAVPMSILHPNLFLFLIAFFSYYFALTGWRYAQNSTGLPEKIDWVVAVIMLIVALSMLGVGVFLYHANATRAITLFAFGFIGLRLSIEDLQICRQGGVRGKQRIIKHLTSMIAATIAAVTAFAVTNVPLKPAIILWLGPTVLLAPVIFWWRKRILKNKIRLARAL